MEKEVSIYFHWPYCKSKCPYCDFYKIVDRNINQAEVIDKYIKDLDDYHKMLPNRVIRSVFFGGGTPSLIEPQYIERLIDHIHKLWSVRQNMEISLEANPNTNKTEMFSNLHAAGINRLSLGVQALNERDLKFLGRTHTLKDALESIDDVLCVFDNHSMDLIYARPEQTMSSWMSELEQAVSFGFKHLSLYQLTIEEGTVFERKGVKALEVDQAAEMYQQTVDFLRNNGYPRYEVSNFATEKYESVHNKCYWMGDDYIGIGKGAHGRLKADGQHYALEYPNINEKLSPYERAQELILMGLRLEKGIQKQYFEQICGLSFNQVVPQLKIDELSELKLIKNEKDRIFATDKGFLVLNKIIEELCA